MSKPSQSPSPQVSQDQVEQQLNQLVSEIRILESYHNEIVSKIQSASAALTDVRSTIQSIDGIVEKPNGEFLIPIGAGLLLPTSNIDPKKLVLSVGAGVAIEKDPNSAKAFLQAREREYSAALNAMEQQRKEVSSRLEAGKNFLQQFAGQG